MAININNMAGDAFGGFIKGLGGVGQALPYIFALLLMGGVFFLIWWNMQYNKRLMLYKLTGNSFRLIVDKARIKKDKNGVKFYKLKALKLIVDIPPSSCMIYSKKGEIASGYLNNQGEIVWIKHGYTPEQIEEAIKKGRELDPHDRAVSNFIKSFRPVTTTQRASYAYQYDQAKSYLKSDFMKQNIPIIIGGIFVVLVLAIFMMFWGKVMQPTLEAQKTVTEYEKVKLDELQVWRDISTGVQRIQKSMNITNEGVPVE